MREQIRKEITTIHPMDEKERFVLNDVLNWVDSGVELCRLKKPATPEKHLVSYFALIDGDHVLLVDHINAELWLPTGGHVEKNEHPRDTVLRESKEELGIDAEFLIEEPILITSTVTVGKTSGHTDVSLWYALKGDRQSKLEFDVSEFHSVKWFHKDEILGLQTDPEMWRFIKKLYQKLKMR